MKLIKKITFIIIFIFVNVNAFGAVSRVVDSFQVTQRIPTGVVFNPDGTKMFISGMSQNRVMEFDLTTGFDVSEATINSNECDHADKDGNVVDLRLRADHHAQYEIRAYADAMLDTVKKWVPITYDAFMDYRVGGTEVSSKGKKIIQKLIGGEEIDAEKSGLSKREWNELMIAFDLKDKLI